MQRHLALYLLALGFVLDVTSKAFAEADTFTTIDFPGASLAIAVGVNPHGDIVGQYISAGVSHGFLLSGDEFTSIDYPGASFTLAEGINSEGDIVGRYISADAPTILYAGTFGDGVFKTTNQGDNWVAASIGLGRAYVLSLAIDADEPMTLYGGGGGGGVFRSSNGADTWDRIPGMSNQSNALAIDSTASTLYAGTAERGVFVLH